MKSLKFVCIAFVIALLVSSCVSSKKYNEALSVKTAKEQAYAAQLVETSRLNAENNVLQNENKNLATENSTLRSNNILSNEAKKAGEIKVLLKEKREAINILKQKVDIALKDFNIHELQINAINGRLYVSMSDNLLFQSESKVLRERGGIAVRRLAEVIPGKDYEIAIVGHPDSILPHGSVHKDNWDLSLQRASAAAHVFIAEGIPTESIFITGETKYHAIDPNETKEGRHLYRRTEFVITPKLDDLWKLTEETEVEKLDK